MRAVIIEDEGDANELFCEMFRTMGWDCIGICYAEKALEAINKTLPDLVFTDVMMVGISGIEICRSVKKNKKTKHIPIVIVSAKSMPDDIQRGLDAGADEYLTKPAGYIEIKECVEKVLRGKRLGLYSE